MHHPKVGSSQKSFIEPSETDGLVVSLLNSLVLADLLSVLVVLRAGRPQEEGLAGVRRLAGDAPSDSTVVVELTDN